MKNGMKNFEDSVTNNIYRLFVAEVLWLMSCRGINKSCYLSCLFGFFFNFYFFPSSVVMIFRGSSTMKSDPYYFRSLKLFCYCCLFICLLTQIQSLFPKIASFWSSNTKASKIQIDLIQQSLFYLDLLYFDLCQRGFVISL